MLLSLLLLPFFAGVAACFATLEQPKRPPSSYMLWLNENRPRLVKELGTKRVADVAKAAGMQWKDLGEKEKLNYAVQVDKQKAIYAKQVEEFIAAGGVLQQGKRGVLQQGKPGKESKKTKKDPNTSKKPAKAKKDPNAPKKPATAYFLWLKDSRAEIAASLPAGSKVTDVAKAAGVRWKEVAAAEKQSYEEKYAVAKAEYKQHLEEYQAMAA